MPQGARVAAQQIAERCLQTDGLVEGAKDQQTLWVDQIAQRHGIFIDAQLAMAVVFQHPQTMPVQYLSQPLALVTGHDPPAQRLHSRRQNRHFYLAVLQQGVEFFRVNLALGIHAPLDHANAKGLQGTQHAPAAGRFHQHRAIAQLQGLEHGFQHAGLVRADEHIVRVPAMFGGAGVVRRQRRAQLDVAKRLKTRIGLTGIMAHQVALKVQQRAIKGLQQRRLIGAKHEHVGPSGAGLVTLQQILAFTWDIVTGLRERVVARFRHRADAPFLFQQRIGVLHRRDRHPQTPRQQTQGRQLHRRALGQFIGQPRQVAVHLLIGKIGLVVFHRTHPIHAQVAGSLKERFSDRRSTPPPTRRFANRSSSPGPCPDRWHARER